MAKISVQSTGKLWEESFNENSIDDVSPQIVEIIRSVLVEPENLLVHELTEQRLRFIVLWFGYKEVKDLPDVLRMLLHLRSVWKLSQFYPYSEREKSKLLMKDLMKGNNCYLVRLSTTVPRCFVLLYTVVDMCPVCLDVYDAYQTFTCGHHICTACFENLLRKNCPKCRKLCDGLHVTHATQRSLLSLNDAGMFVADTPQGLISGSTVLKTIENFDKAFRKVDANVDTPRYANGVDLQELIKKHVKP
jgi:hypothetical protein